MSLTHSWTGNLFGGLVTLFLVLTFVLARSLGIIMKTWDGLTKKLSKLIGTERKSAGVAAESSTKHRLGWPRSGDSTGVQSAEKWPLLHIKRRKTTPKLASTGGVKKMA